MKLKMSVSLLVLVLLVAIFPFSAFASSGSSVVVKKSPPIMNIDPDLRDPVDITQSFTNQMKANVLIMSQMVDGTNWAYKTEYWVKQVRSGGPWDYKLTYGYSVKYKFNGRIVTGEDLGNIHYGYVGSYFFGTSLLKSAAGAVQIYSGTSYPGWYNSYFDDPNDQAMIDWGISLAGH